MRVPELKIRYSLACFVAGIILFLAGGPLGRLLSLGFNLLALFAQLSYLIDDGNAKTNPFFLRTFRKSRRALPPMELGR
jgi:hypothetical protein